MYELIVKFVYDEMNIRRCIKKSIAVQGPSAPWAAVPLSGLATADAPTAVVAEAAGCTSCLSPAALSPLVASNQPSIRVV